ncbi:hypothetical protein KVR01_006285 [Diaporthe batatas]|uniref:uncharacterized protein n=1 Tax=Diaporthe batatas TaxID=748121 RepID=UPI001D03CD0C|nr:uncharacterized protein KVR01_006285 [Diaporthe batatas]KAG8164367.1 hypothetical protein KVR01_006285 [Diaporthe batatas]
MTFLSNLAPRLPREIPGFYYDEDKKRYFKIESHPTAPANAAWAAGNVKKRKAEKAQAQQKRKRQDKLKGCIKPSAVLAHPLVGGRLRREFGVVDYETPVESWAAGLRQKGEVSFLPGRERQPDPPSISCLLVEGGDEAAGLGMAYAAVGGRQLESSYIPTDKDERINFGSDSARMRAPRLSALQSEEIQGGISSIAYHRGSHTMIVASTATSSLDVESRGRINLFQPALAAELPALERDGWFLRQFGSRRPTWLLGETSAYVSYTSPVRGLTIHTVRACPASTSGSGTEALIATSHGIMSFDGEINWVTPKPPANLQLSPSSSRRGNHHHRGGGGTRALLRDVFSVDYSPSNPRVCYAGCRDSRVFRVDMRAPPPGGDAGWDSFRHVSSAAHVRCLDDHRVLVAGPRSAMAIYDTRWAAPRRSSSHPSNSGRNDYRNNNNRHYNNNNNNNNIAQPVVQFPGYSNEAHIQIGLDVTHDAGGPCGSGSGGGGIAAAALGDGTVGIFSLRTGRRLRAGDVDDPRVLKAPGTGAGGVVRALQFQRLPWEKEASLFVGVGPVVKKFTFGVGDGEEDW